MSQKEQEETYSPSICTLTRVLSTFKIERFDSDVVQNSTYLGFIVDPNSKLNEQVDPKLAKSKSTLQ